VVFNATFNYISVISRLLVLLVEETGENTDLSQVTLRKIEKHAMLGNKTAKSSSYWNTAIDRETHCIFKKDKQ
jgi:hypothetical protein